MKKSLLLITVLAVVGLVAGCAALDVMDVVGIESDLLSPKMEERKRQETERKRRETERIYQRGLTLCVRDPEGDPRRKPDGFRGIKFGTDISALEDMEFMRERIISDVVEGKEWKTKVYTRKNEIMTLGDTPLSRIEYFFHEGKFCYVELVTTTGIFFLQTDCRKQFGYPSCEAESGDQAWVWKNTIVDIDIEVIRSGDDLWEREKKGSFAAMPKDMTWEETKFMYKTGIDTEPVAAVGPAIKQTIRLRIMTKEAAKHLGYRVKVVEKKERGGF